MSEGEILTEDERGEVDHKGNLKRLCTLPAFQESVLGLLKSDFLEAFHMANRCAAGEEAKPVAEASYIANLYEELTGETIIS